VNRRRAAGRSGDAPGPARAYGCKPFRVVTLITDDLDGSETAQTITFSLEGASYEIDLTNAHAEELRSVLEPYMKAGRKTCGRRDGPRRSQGASADKDQIKAIRDWAKKQG
jgi:hypothetical protein